jgi:transposase
MPDLDALSREELIAIVREAFAAIEALQATVAELKERVQALEEENARLRNGPPDGTLPPLGRQQPVESKPKVRKKRGRGYSRMLEAATEVRTHAAETCPDCGRKLSGGTVHRRRQVIEIPVVRYQVIEHQIWARHCGVCKKRVLPKADCISDAVGSCRMGPRLTALVSYLKMRCRVPLRIIQSLLEIQFGLKVSLGQLTEMLHRAAAYGRQAYQQLLEEVRGSPGVCADETGWYMNGAYQCLWTFSTPRVRFFRLAGTRAAVVPKEVLEGFRGVLSSDFYSGYNWYLGDHQYCWAHLLRALHDLKEEHASDPSVVAWVDAVKVLFDLAREYRDDHPARRRKERFRLQRALETLARPFEASAAPQGRLARRILKFLPHLLVFVEKPEIAPDNNMAERSLRPIVIARKVFGGTRSDKGSATIETLMSLFGTWSMRGLNELDTCAQLLTA